MTVCIKSGMCSIFFDGTKMSVVSWDEVVHQVCDSICLLLVYFCCCLAVFVYC